MVSRGGMRADMILEKELRTLHLAQQAGGDCGPCWAGLEHTSLQSLPLQRHTSSSKATLSNSATLYDHLSTWIYGAHTNSKHHTYPHIRTDAHRQTYRHTQYTYTYIPTHAHAYIHAHTNTHHTHIYLHTQTYAHMHIHINTLTHGQTHT